MSYHNVGATKPSVGDQFKVITRKPGGGGGGGGGKSDGLMKYAPYAAGAVGLGILVILVSGGSKKSSSSERSAA